MFSKLVTDESGCGYIDGAMEAATEPRRSVFRSSALMPVGFTWARDTELGRRNTGRMELESVDSGPPVEPNDSTRVLFDDSRDPVRVLSDFDLSDWCNHPSRLRGFSPLEFTSTSPL